MFACGFESARVSILSKFVNFFTNLRSSASKEVQILSRFVARDVRSTTGRNLQFIVEATGLSPWTSSTKRIKNVLVQREYVSVPEADFWRLPYLESLLNQRRSVRDRALDDLDNHLSDLITSLVIN